MGQRANYILIENETQVIHYNHWRANSIAADLFLGEARFIAFVRDCTIESQLMNDPWIEGCVVIDIQKKQLHFWSSEFGQTSVVDIYLKELQSKWKGWSVNLLYNRMYDVEKILNIAYVSKQEIRNIHKVTKEKIISDTVTDYANILIIIKNENQLFVTKTASLPLEAILKFGKNSIALLLDKPTYDLPKEEDDEVYECMVIDTQNKKIIIGKSEYGLMEQALEDWEEYEFEIGDFGYVRTLKMANIDTAEITMSLENATADFEHMVQQHDDFNPENLADKIREEFSDVTFNPDFFDNVKPKKSLLEKMKGIFGRN